MVEQNTRATCCEVFALAMSTYKAELSPLSSMDVLQSEWTSVEESSDNTFFLSWTWVKTWLDAIQPNAEVLKVWCGSELVGIALVVLKRTGFGIKRSLFLHQTGDAQQDQMWIEYNGILTKPAHRQQAEHCFIHFLVERNDWDDLVFGGVLRDLVLRYAEQLNLPSRELWRTHTYGVQLDFLEGEYLDSLSRNTRYQINRSFKAYVEQGAPLAIEFAASPEQAQQFFEAAGPFHLQRWGDEPSQSGFANPSFVRFHQQLIESAWKSGQVALARLSHGEKELGYFYFFIYRGTAFFYLSGLAREQDSKLKPGLCGHALCIEHFKKLGLTYYDLMGGDDRYKKSIAKQQHDMCGMKFQRPTASYYTESVLRAFKQQLRRRWKST